MRLRRSSPAQQVEELLSAQVGLTEHGVVSCFLDRTRRKPER